MKNEKDYKILERIEINLKLNIFYIVLFVAGPLEPQSHWKMARAVARVMRPALIMSWAPSSF